MVQTEQRSVMVLPDGRVPRCEAARFLGVATKTMAEWQRLGRGPRSRLVGSRRFYMIDDLRAFAEGKAA